MRRISLFRFSLLITLLSLPLLALAQAAAPAQAPAHPSIAETFLVQYVLPAVGGVFAIVLAAVGAVLAGWIRSKGATEEERKRNEKIAAFTEKTFSMAKDAVAYVDAQTKATQQRISADGQITAEEAKELQDEALSKLKAWLGENFPAQAKDLLGIAAPAVDTWLQGILQRAFALKPEKTLWQPTGPVAPAVVISSPSTLVAGDAGAVAKAPAAQVQPSPL
jgi:hypothetical protein